MLIKIENGNIKPKDSYGAVLPALFNGRWDIIHLERTEKKKKENEKGMNSLKFFFFFF